MWLPQNVPERYEAQNHGVSPLRPFLPPARPILPDCLPFPGHAPSSFSGRRPINSLSLYYPHGPSHLYLVRFVSPVLDTDLIFL